MKTRRILNVFLIMMDTAQKKPILRMGGGIGKFTYTNSKEAVLDSVKKNFRFIEIDLIKTSDGHLFAAHDWKSFKSLAGISNHDKIPLTLDEAIKLKIKGTFSPLDGSGIRKIMETHRDFILVTDKIADYDLFLKEIPFPERMIVEVFSPEDYLKALQSGVKYPAYCIWGKKEYQIATRFRFPIVTMSAYSFFDTPETTQMAQNLHNNGTAILLFGTGKPYWDKKDFVREHLGKTVSKIYTDRFSPADMPQ
ncbi:MAG: hypothetical protein NC211_04465 [Alistipes senegalensis]|nr:hypothetical protein [Alistipes senegalensis]